MSNADIYAIIRVTDPDPDRHGEVGSVEIIEGDPEAHFRIRQSPNQESKEFNIEVLKLLDREISPFGYNLTLKAVDRGVPPRIYYKNVHVQLTDVNDHAPVFGQQVYEVKVNESAPPNARLARLKVSDEDEGRNAAVTLRITAGNENGNFRVDPKSGVLYVAKPLDAERQSSYTLTVSALDHANAGMRKQSSAKVHVLVVDVNDNSPLFDVGPTKTVYFEENQPSGTRVIRLRADDADSGENGYVSYSLANLNDVPFEIDPFTGVIKATKLIDFESDRREYHLLVRASDWGTPYRRQAELRLTIRVKDINDNRPQFERIKCQGRIERDTPVGSEILTLSAIDFDNGDLISYRIVSGNADGCFALDSSKGVLATVCDLRTLPMRHRVINVTATDGQHFSDVTPIRIEMSNGGGGKSGFGSKIFAAKGVDDSLFECSETGVAKRLTETLALAESNNDVSGEEDVFATVRRSRYGSNIHHPEFDRQNMPGEIRVSETQPPGTKLMKVGAESDSLNLDVSVPSFFLLLPTMNGVIHPLGTRNPTIIIISLVMLLLHLCFTFVTHAFIPFCHSVPPAGAAGVGRHAVLLIHTFKKSCYIKQV